PSACVTNPTTTPCNSANYIPKTYTSSYQCGTPGQYTVTKIVHDTVHGRTTDVGLYAEDDWKVKPNLTLSFGIRYEAQNIINSNHDFAPRLSFAWGIPRKGKSPITVVRGGYGIFYDRFTLTNYLNTLQLNGIVQQKTTVINPGVACTPDHSENCGSPTTRR